MNDKRPTRELYVYHGDDMIAVEDARAEVNRLFARDQALPASRRLGDGSDLASATEAYDAVVAEALPRATLVKVSALPRKAYRDILQANPPREGHADDEALQYNVDAVQEALVEFFDLETGERTVVEPKFDSKQKLVEWVEALNYGNFVQIAAAAIDANETGSPNPKARVASQVAQWSGATSPRADSSD